MGYPLTAGHRSLRLVALPPWTRTAAGVAGMAAVIVTTALIALDAASGPSYFVDDGRPVPPSVLGPLAGHGGSVLYAPRFWSLILLMSAGYGLLVCAGRLPTSAAIVGIAVIQALVLLAPPFASDVFSYIDYARLAVVHGVNPYAHSPAFVPGDPVFGYIGRLWLHMPSAYGPLFTVASYPAALMGIAGGVAFLKGLAVASSLALVGLTAATARRLGRDPVRAALVVGANPILIVFGAQGAHNDLPMLALVMLGVWLTVRGRAGLGAGGAVLGAAVKASAALVLPFMLLGSGERRRSLGGIAAGALAVAAGALAVFGSHAFGFVGVLQRQQSLVTPNSFPSEVARLFGQLTIPAAERTLLHVLLAAALVYLLVRVWRGADWISGAGWAMLAATVTATWVLAWYALWALPFAAVGRDRRLIAAVFLVQGLYLVHRGAPQVMRG